MKKYLFCLLIFISSLSYGQSWLWVSQGLCLSRGYADIYSIATDNDGNIFEAGLGQGPLLYQGDSIIPQSNSYYAYIVKYDLNGNVLWTRNAINHVNSFANYVATDKSGNSYITGDFQDTISFDSARLDGDGYGVCDFVTCYSPNGVVKWAISDSNNSTLSSGESNWDCTDKHKNIYITGWYADTVFWGSHMLTGKHIQNFYIVKLDSLGNVLWAKNASSASRSYSAGAAVISDDSGNAYLTGTFEDTMSIGTFTLRSKGISLNTFVVKYDSSGNVKWVQYSEISNSSYFYSTAIAIDNSRNLCITGYFGDTVICGIDTLRTKYQSAFLSKLSPTGQFIWSKGSVKAGIHGNYTYPWSVSIDKNKNIYTCGTFQDSLNFCGIHLISDSMEPSYLIKTDSLGNGICGILINNVNDDQNAIALDPLSNDIYFGGDYDDSECIIGTDTLLNTLEFGENSFLAKWQPCDYDASVNELSIKTGYISLFPNPNNGFFTIALSHAELVSASQPTIEVYNILGEKVYYETLKQVQGDNKIDLSSQPNGVYLYRVVDETGALLGSGKFIIAK